MWASSSVREDIFNFFGGSGGVEWMEEGGTVGGAKMELEIRGFENERVSNGTKRGSG